MVSDVGGCSEAWCLSEKRARKRWARGADSEDRTLRRGGIVVSSEFRGVGGDVAEGAMMAKVQMARRGRTGKSQIDDEVMQFDHPNLRYLTLLYLISLLHHTLSTLAQVTLLKVKYMYM